MFSTLNFKINVPTPVDFLLHFSHRALDMHEAQALVFKALPQVYFITVNYDLSRGQRTSSIALAALCHALQDKNGACEAFPNGFEEAKAMRDAIILGVADVLDNEEDTFTLSEVISQAKNLL